MSTVYYCSDLHLEHKGIFRYRDNCSDQKSLQKLIRDNWRASKKDVVYFLGDIMVCVTEEAMQFIKSLPAKKKVLIAGNHDAERKGCLADLEECFDEIVFQKSKSKILFTHMPLHNCVFMRSDTSGFINVHGHMHQDLNISKNHFNVCMDVILPKYGVIMMRRDEIFKALGAVGK